MHYFVDAFAGAGGMCLGLQNAGLDPILSFDFDDHCIETMNKNKKYFNHQALKIDVNSLLEGNWKKVLKVRPGELFLMAGGPPCQGFSIQRIGSDLDDRNDLVISYVKLICEIKPKFFILENVAGLTGKRGKEVLSRAIEIAEKSGYYIHKQVIDAQDYGVPQRRKRLFVVGEFIESGFSPCFEFPKALGKKLTVRDAIGNLPSAPIDGTEHPTLKHHRADKLSELNKKRLSVLKPGQGMVDLPKHLRADCHKAGADKIGHRNVYGRMSWNDVAPTITARFDSFTRGQFGHPKELRSISLREGALLQTFPADFEFIGNKVDIARQIGNAVPPTLACSIGSQILKCYKNKINGRSIKKKMEFIDESV